MQDIIQLLPDHLANQIAAGEVIQRPASAVKELMENAIDAGATEITLIVKDAGKELIQVIDNGKGMSPIDARMSFERHATSKIRKIDDLFSIKTMGFRGEALASIAAVAQVELKTRTATDEVGTCIIIESSEVKSQEPIACSVGTNFSIKNLFYNVPARRKFLKSNTTEFRQIVDEFSRIAMAYPEISFRLFHNNTEQFHLNQGTLKSRIIDLLGPRSEKNLVPVEEDANDIHIHGFIGKPQAATKTRGQQFFFINNRFIKSAYLNHAVLNAFEGLIEKDSYPLYVLFFHMDPEKVDVNVHPNKQEVKFEDESLLYAYLQASVKHALAKFNIAPSIDFTLNPEIQNLDALRIPQSQLDVQRVQTGYLQHSFSEGGRAHFIAAKQDREDWKKQQTTFFQPNEESFPPLQSSFPSLPSIPEINTKNIEPDSSTSLFHENNFNAPGLIRWNSYLISTVKSGVLLLHQKRALERISYERLKTQMQPQTAAWSQQLLFPIPMQIAPMDQPIIEAIMPFLKKIGFDIESMSGNDFVIQGIPSQISEGRAPLIIEEILAQAKVDTQIIKDPENQRLLILMSKQMANASLQQEINGQDLIDELFACEMPQFAPDGKSIFKILAANDLEHLL